MANTNLKKKAKLSPQDAAQGRVMIQASADCRWFCRYVMGYNAWGVQEEIMAAISRPFARVAVKACHSSGKTSVAAHIALWMACTGGQVITTAPTWAQVEMLLWQEIHEAHERCREAPPGTTVKPLGGVLNKTQFNVAPGVWARGISTNEAVRFQGFHARAGQRLLFILDEAPGVKPDIWEAIEGAATGGDVRILALGNPVIGSGPFYNAFTKERDVWTTFTIDAFMTPNFEDVRHIARQTGQDWESVLLALSDDQLNDNPRDYLITKRAVKQRYLSWGPGSPIYQARVRGQFPSQADDALLALDWLELARTRQLAEPPLTVGWWAGIDVAGPGEDDTVVTVRHGDVIKHIQYFKDRDPREKVWQVLEPYVDYGININVDTIGQGYYFAHYLRDILRSRMATHCHVYDVDVGKAPLDRDQYANLKAEAYWTLRDRFMHGRISFGQADSIGPDGRPIAACAARENRPLEQTIEQLASLRYEQTERNLIKIESKKKAKERGIDSPDGAESVMLAFHDPLQYEIEDAGDIGAALEQFTGLGWSD